MKKENVIKVRVDANLYDQIHEFMEENDMNLSEAIREILKSVLD